MAVKRRQMCNWFWRMVEGMPLREVFRVLACGQNIPDVMFFDHVGRQVKHFASMIFAMACRIPIGTSQPQTCSWWLCECLLYKSLGKPFTPGNRNYAGSWCLANLVSRGGRFCILKKPYVHPCDVPMPSAVEEFFTEVKTSFYREVMKIRHRSSRFHSKFSNVFGIIRFAFECFRQGPYPCTQNRQRRWILPCVKRSFETRDRVGFEHWFALQ